MKKIKWYHKVICFFISHKEVKISEYEFKENNISIYNNTLKNVNLYITNNLLIELKNEKSIYYIKQLLCERCGIYQEITIDENPDYLTEE
jgi:surface polysaccharide O-acyltransferase-like enzyme